MFVCRGFKEFWRKEGVSVCVGLRVFWTCGDCLCVMYVECCVVVWFSMNMVVSCDHGVGVCSVFSSGSSLWFTVFCVVVSCLPFLNGEKRVELWLCSCESATWHSNDDPSETKPLHMHRI